MPVPRHDDEDLGSAVVVFDKQSSPETRRQAVNDLVVADPVVARAVLLRAAADETDDEDYLRFVGRALGLLAIEQGYLTEWDLRDMSDPAYDAYCEAYRPPPAPA